MKRIIVFIFTFLFILSGCTNNSSNTSTENPEYLSFLEGKSIIEAVGIGEIGITPDLNTFLPISNEIVLAKVEDISYKAIPGTGGAWTVANIDIIKSYKGQFKEGDKIDIYYVGGYISVEDHIKLCNDEFRFKDMTDEEKKNTYFHEVINGENFDPVGKIYLLCLNPTLEGSPLPEEAYERLPVYSQMEYIEENNTFVQTLWDIAKQPQNIYTEEEILEYISKGE